MRSLHEYEDLYPMFDTSLVGQGDDEVREEDKHPIEKESPILYNFLQHLSSGSFHPNDYKHLQEAGKAQNLITHPLGSVIKAGIDAKPTGGFSHMREGFGSAMHPETGEVHPQHTKESRGHFSQFVQDRGGYAAASQTKLLTTDNKKITKSRGIGYHTAGLFMAPHKTSGAYDMCPKASSECRANCLGTTAGGNRQYPETALKGKVLRTQYVHEHPQHAARVLDHEITKHEQESKKLGVKAGVRLNGTSDIPWEHTMPKGFFNKHKDTTFYDYTKIPGRVHNYLDGKMPKNYHLALSHTGTGHAESNDKDAVNVLNKGGVVAMVHQRSEVKPTHVEDVQSGKRWKITNGDNDDAIFLRHKQAGVPKGEGVVSGLALKGVSNQAAGHFANKVDPDGIIRINHPKKQSPFPIVGQHEDIDNMLRRVAGLPESEEKHLAYKDPAQSPYHKTLLQHGFQHISTEHKRNPLAPKHVDADYTEHRYTHPDRGKSHVIVRQDHVRGGGGHVYSDDKGHSYIFRHEQENGIMAPTTGDSKVQLHRTLSNHYGVPAGVAPPKISAADLRYSRIVGRPSTESADDVDSMLRETNSFLKQYKPAGKKDPVTGFGNLQHEDGSRISLRKGGSGELYWHHYSPQGRRTGGTGVEALERHLSSVHSPTQEGVDYDEIDGLLRRIQVDAQQVQRLRQS